MNYDSLLKSIFFINTKRGIVFNANLFRLRLDALNGYDNIKHYLLVRFDDSESYRESLYRIYLGIEHRPHCKHCGASLKPKFHLFAMFDDYCCRACSNASIKKLNDTKQTCLSKYGAEYFAMTAQYKRSFKRTMNDRYGVDYLMQHTAFKNKRDDTLRNHHYFGRSSQEDIVYHRLIDMFGNVLRSYKSDDYPYKCDFYLPQYNIYIECNYFWTHNDHPYDPNSDDDNDIVECWRNKKSKFYDNAIRTWTIYDKQKIETAINNNLNYVIFWHFNDLDDDLSKITNLINTI